MPALPDDAREQLTAYLDGEMDKAAAAAFEKRLRRDPALRLEAETLKRTWDLLDFLPQPEPSPTFTTRTLDKLEIVRPVPTTIRPGPTPRTAMWRRRVAVIVAAAVLFLAGYLLPGRMFSSGSRSMRREEAERQIARDLRLLESLPQYQVGESVEFLIGLDDPDLFGN